MESKKKEVWNEIMLKLELAHLYADSKMWEDASRAYGEIDGMMRAFGIIFDEEREFVSSWKRELEKEKKEKGII